MNNFVKYTKILLIAILCFSLSLLFVACGEPGEKGDKGDKGDTGVAGVGIVSIVKDSTNGNVDTYKITMSDGSTTFFTVTNSVNNVCQHQYGNNIDIVNNCEVRVSTKTCTLCGDNDVVVDDEPKHTYLTKTDTYEHWQECSVCDVKKDVAAHTITLENECQSCDYTCKPLDGMEFALNDDGMSYALINTAKNQAKIEIPRYYQGKPVTKIGGNVFFEDYSVKEISIPEGITGLAYIDNYGAAQKISFPKSFEGFDLLPEEYLWSEFNSDLFDLQCVDFRDNENIEDILFNYYEEDGYTFNYGLMYDADTEFFVSKNNANYVVKDDMLLTKDQKTLLLYMPTEAVDSAVEIPDGVETIKSFAFYGKKNINFVYIPDSVIDIEGWVFEFCEDLMSVRLPANIQKIPSGTFYACKSLLSIENMSKVEIIEDYAFGGCENLRKLANADSLQKIGYGAFQGCRNLHMQLPDSVLEIYDYAFEEAGFICFGKDSKLKKIGYASFRNANTHGARVGLVEGMGNTYELRLPDSLEEIGDYAFENLGQNVNYDGEWSAPQDFFELIISPNSQLRSIGSYAFSNARLNNVSVLPSTIEEMGYNVFTQMMGNVLCNSPSKPSGWADNWCTIYGSSYSSGNPYDLYWNCEGFYEDENGVDYVLFNDKTACVLGGGNGQGKHLEFNVPGYTITTIAKSAYDNGRFASVKIPDTVTTIKDYAFIFCSDVESIIIPSSVITIGNAAFSGVSYDDNPEPLKVYAEVSSKPDGWNYNWAYSDTIVYWYSATRPTTSGNWWLYVDGVATVWEDFDFTYTTSNNQVTITGYTGTDANIVIPATIGNKPVTAIGDNAFKDNTTITSVTIPDGVTSIGAYAFANCSGLINIVFPSSVTNVGEYAFHNCSNVEGVYITDLTAWCNISFGGINANPLNSGASNPTNSGGNLYLNGDKVIDLVIPTGIEQIKNRAFDSCTSITSVTIPSSVKSIGLLSFAVCRNIESVIFEDNSQLATIGERAFINCDSLANIIIPDSVTSIDERAFLGCDNLATVTFGENSKLTSIGQGAFRDCTNLTNITIPNDVTSIGEYAFENCTKLRRIIIPSSVTSIGERAFYYCNSLTIYCEATSQPSGWDETWNPDNRPAYWYNERPTIGGNWWYYVDGDAVIWGGAC